MAPTRDNYYANQQSIQGLVYHHPLLPKLDLRKVIRLKDSIHVFFSHDLCYNLQGQLNSIAPSHDSYYGTPPTIHGLVHRCIFSCLLLCIEFAILIISSTSFSLTWNSQLQGQMDFFRTPSFTYGIRVCVLQCPVLTSIKHSKLTYDFLFRRRSLIYVLHRCTKMLLGIHEKTFP